MNNLKIREIKSQDYFILEDFLYNAAFVPPGEEPFPREIIFEPEIYIYIKDFGKKDDCGVVAEMDGKIVGAAWTRIIPAYGHIDSQTPELAISVLPEWRGQSIGTQLMQYLFYLLYKRGYKQTSLSVQKDNPAVRFYERLGYEITGERLDHANNEDYLMIKPLNPLKGTCSVVELQIDVSQSPLEGVGGKTIYDSDMNIIYEMIKNLQNMKVEDQTIYDFDMNIIYEYFSNVERQGPGSPEMTIKALSFIDNLTDKSRIADIGCGTGGQTMTLAQNAPGEIIGVELWSDFVNQFNQNAKNKNLQNRVKGIVGNMENLPFQEEEFDLIWSEGAIYNIGFERGLNEWRKFLKTGGYIAVSEASWFTNERPAEIQDFWQRAYPEIDTIPNCVAKMQNAGYVPVATFILPENCWTDNFYVPLIPVQEALLKKYAGNKSVEDYVAYERYESGLYDKYKAYYGYVFYIGKKLIQNLY
jgi:ribosomal protein S18 acetylase RimI-like enzyme/SAM-dependent methyltransferase